MEILFPPLRNFTTGGSFITAPVKVIGWVYFKFFLVVEKLTLVLDLTSVVKLGWETRSEGRVCESSL